MTITRLAAATTLATATVCLSACSGGSPGASHTVTKTVTASPSSDDQSADVAADALPQKVTPSLYHAYSWTYGLAEGDKGSTDPRDNDLPPYILPKNAETIRTSDGALTVGLNLRYTSMHDSTPALTCDNDLALSHALTANDPNQDVACPTNAADIPVTWSINQFYRPTKVSATNLPDPVKVVLVSGSHRVPLFSALDDPTTASVVVPKSEAKHAYFEVHDHATVTKVSLLGQRI